MQKRLLRGLSTQQQARMLILFALVSACKIRSKSRSYTQSKTNMLIYGYFFAFFVFALETVFITFGVFSAFAALVVPKSLVQ